MDPGARNYNYIFISAEWDAKLQSWSHTVPLHKATADVDPQLEEWEGVQEDPAVAHLTQERNHLLSDVKNDENKIMWAK